MDINGWMIKRSGPPSNICSPVRTDGNLCGFLLHLAWMMWVTWVTWGPAAAEPSQEQTQPGPGVRGAGGAGVGGAVAGLASASHQGGESARQPRCV